jgi:cell division protein FtsW (lipid II flippase)
MLAAGLLCSYSGTGLTMLALFLPFYFLRHGHSRLFVFAAVLGVVLVAFGDMLSLDAFTRRFDEFSDPQSSGWARFLSMFRVLQDVVFATDLTFCLGRGPGTVQEQFRLLSFSAFDPTWGKIIYEYGLLGAVVYFRLFYVAVCRGPRGLRFAVGYTYLFLGGYLLNPSILMQLAALVVWLGKEAVEDRQELNRRPDRAIKATDGMLVPGLQAR